MTREYRSGHLIAFVVVVLTHAAAFRHLQSPSAGAPRVEATPIAVDIITPAKVVAEVFPPELEVEAPRALEPLPKIEPPAPVPVVEPEEVKPEVKPEQPKPKPKRKPVPKPAEPKPAITVPAETAAAIEFAQPPPAEPPQSAPPVTATVPEPAAAPETAPAAATSAVTEIDPTPLPIIPPRSNANYLQNPTPPYPPRARRLGMEGKVMLRVLVNAEGLPEEIQLRNSSGADEFDSVALQTVKRWKFVPARRGDNPVPAWVVIPIVFSLDG